MEKDNEIKKWLCIFLMQKFMGKKEYKREKSKEYGEKGIR